MSIFKKSNDKQQAEPDLSFGESLIVLIVILCILGLLIIIKHQQPQAPLFIAFTLLAIYGKLRGFSWDTVMNGMRHGLRAGVDPLIIFLSIGVLIATWIFSGTIPTIMFFGFKIISVKFFLPTVFLVCTLVGVACGSSFTTVSTMGIAFIGIGATLKINPGLTAGVIVSGAFCGSNISPLSGTTNLAASVGEISIYEHIRSLLVTDIPAWAVCMVVYTFLGLNSKSVSLAAVHRMMNGLQNGFWISGWAMLPVVLLIVLAILQVPAIPSLGLGSKDAHFHAALRLSQLGLHFTKSKGDQVSRHPDRLLEVVVTIFHMVFRCVSDYCLALVLVKLNGQGEFSLRRWFVNTWECLSSCSRFKLRTN